MWEAINFCKVLHNLYIIKNKAVDVNVGLRDKLKCYAAENQTSDK